MADKKRSQQAVNSPSPPKRGYSTQEAAHYIGLSDSFLRQARMTGKRARRLDAPKHTQLGCRKIVYLKEHLDEWLDSHASTAA